MSNWNVEFYKSPGGNSPVLSWFQSLEAKSQAKFARIFELLEESGTLVGMPYVRKMTGTNLYEIRVEVNTNIYRIFHVAYTGKRIVLLHGFQKKTQKTPKKEIDLAEKRLKEFIAAEDVEKQSSGKKRRK